MFWFKAGQGRMFHVVTLRKQGKKLGTRGCTKSFFWIPSPPLSSVSAQGIKCTLLSSLAILAPLRRLPSLLSSSSPDTCFQSALSDEAQSLKVFLEDHPYHEERWTFPRGWKKKPCKKWWHKWNATFVRVSVICTGLHFSCDLHS